jgi:hypothetical protein
MTNEFKIDKPGIYRRRDGKEVIVWPLFRTNRWWSGEERYSEPGFSNIYQDNGRLLQRRESQCDITAYIGKLPAEMLQRMREALTLAEENKTSYTITQIKPIIQSVRRLLDAIESIQDWHGTEIGNAINEVEQQLFRPI